MNLRIVHIIITTELSNTTVELCRSLLYKDDIVLLNIDNKSGEFALPPDLLMHPNVHVSEPRIDIYRGDYSFVKAVFHSYNMIRPLIQEHDYINLLSGVDFPIRQSKDLHSFLNLNIGVSFIDCQVLPALDQKYHEGQENTSFGSCEWPFSNAKHYFDRINSENFWVQGTNKLFLKTRTNRFRNSSFIRTVINKLERFRTYNKIKSLVIGLRTVPKKQFYGGSAWFTITKEAMEHVFDFLRSSSNSKEINFYRKLKYPDHVMIQTILANSSLPRVNSDLRYLDWRKADFYGRPAYIDESDIPKMEESNAFFCRKVNQKGVDLIKNSKWMKQDE
jgi:Core-2/I-Branching enzyme